ncbi:MAG: sigma 54-interacting transcriptional regulator [Bilophila wadsworthia]
MISTAGAPVSELLERARCLRTDETILITGESGTGKEVMAGSIHNASRRGSKPFLSINSAAIPATLMESELFGLRARGIHRRQEKRLARHV